MGAIALTGATAYHYTGMEGVHTTLDVAGMIPGLGEPFDAINAGVYSAEGDKLNAGLSVAACIPVAGWLATGGKWADNAVDTYRAFDRGSDAARAGIRGGRTEVVQRAMSLKELKATRRTDLLRGGRGGTHHVSDAVNANAKRARQRLSLDSTPEVRVTMEVPAGRFSTPTRIAPHYKMPGGGLERTATGPIPVKILKVWNY